MLVLRVGQGGNFGRLCRANDAKPSTSDLGCYEFRESVLLIVLVSANAL
jgi:hypothetical protein